MTIAIENYKANHNLWGSDYLHYHLANADGVVSWVNQKTKQKNSQILLNSLNSARRREAHVKSLLSNEDQEFVEKLLSGQLFKEIPEMSESSLRESSISSDGIASAKEQLQNFNIDERLTILNDFAESLKNASSQIYGNNSTILKQIESNYGKIIINEAIASGNFGNTKYEVVNNLINGILNKNAHSFFKQYGEAHSMHTDLVKILTIISALPDITTTDMTVRHGAVNKNTPGTALASNHEIVEELRNKILKFFTEMHKVALEDAVANGMNASEYVGLKTIIEGTEGSSQFLVTGNKNTNTNFIIDPKMKYAFAQTETKLHQTQTKRRKGDVGYNCVIDENGNGHTEIVSIFTVKDYNGVNITPEESGFYTISGELKLQDGTPLLTALYREAQFSYEDVQKMIQFAVGHLGTEGKSVLSDESSLNFQWKQLINYAAYRMFLSALTGLEGTLDTPIFMVLNGKIFSIAELIQRFMRQNGGQVYLIDKVSGGDGLERETYSNMNQWKSFSKSTLNNDVPNLFLAKSRSKLVTQKAYRKMAATKLQIMMNMQDLTGMTQLN